MIVKIEGVIRKKGPTTCYVTVSQGITYELTVPLDLWDSVADNAYGEVLVYHRFTQESQQLYGFGTWQSKELFINLISVHGVGPSAAISLLSAMTPSKLKGVIIQGDVFSLKKVRGIGEKASQAIVLELRDKFAKKYGIPLESPFEQHPQHPLEPESVKEAIEALAVLGINRNTAKTSAAAAFKAGIKDTEGIIKYCLNN